MLDPNQPGEEYNESAIRRVRDHLANDPTDGFDELPVDKEKSPGQVESSKRQIDLSSQARS